MWCVLLSWFVVRPGTPSGLHSLPKYDRIERSKMHDVDARKSSVMVGYAHADNHAAVPSWQPARAVPTRPASWRVQARRWPSGLDPPTQGGAKCERWSCWHLRQRQQRCHWFRFHTPTGTHACSGRSRALQREGASLPGLPRETAGGTSTPMELHHRTSRWASLRLYSRS